MPEPLTPPTPGSIDRALVVLRAAISAVPGVGGPAVEIIGAILAAPLERRRQAWMTDVADGLRELDAKVGGVFDGLENNEAFVSAFLHAYQAALRSHQEEKRRALKNAVLNSTRSDALAIDLQLTFVRFLDELTPSHITLLQRFLEHEEDLREADSYQMLFEILATEVSEVPISTEEFKLLCSDLQSRVLLRISPSVEDFHDIHHFDIVITEQGGPAPPPPKVRVTDLGKRFLAFAAEPVDLAT